MRRTGFNYFSILIWLNGLGFFSKLLLKIVVFFFFFNASPKVQPRWSGQGRIRVFLVIRRASRVHSQICFSCRPEDESGREYRERERDYDRDQERILRERERLKRQEEERRRQKERYEKEKAFKRKEEEMKKEKETLRDKGKKPESTEPVGSSEKTEKKEEVVKRDRIRNKVLHFIKLLFMRIFFVFSCKYKGEG